MPFLQIISVFHVRLVIHRVILDALYFASRCFHDDDDIIAFFHISVQLAG